MVETQTVFLFLELIPILLKLDLVSTMMVVVLLAFLKLPDNLPNIGSAMQYVLASGLERKRAS
jgi:hypothetical protein